MPYLMYLRKSRADKESEARGEGETLARHEQLLTQLALKMNLTVEAVYKELVSGETISARPKMQQLLIEVMQGKWDGVLVMEVERLARGDTKDQGTVAEAFKFSNTKIITPLKIFDPSNEYDEEYFEFNLFMSRREYKTINRRIQRGRIAAFKDGWYIAGLAPYGYEKVKHKGDKGCTLEMKEEEAKAVRLIYDLYTIGELQDDGSYLHLGSYQIRDRLNQLSVPSPSHGSWSASAVLDILQNPIYYGYQRWSWRKVEKKMIGESIIESRPKDENCPKVRGRHTPIISENTFMLAKRIRESKLYPVLTDTTLQNPLTGLICCAKCNTLMCRQLSNTKDHYPILRCPNSKCSNISSPLYLIEEKLISGLEEWLPNYELKWKEQNNKLTVNSTTEMLNASIKKMETELDLTERQIINTFDYLEQGIYSPETFLERRKLLENKKSSLNQELDQLNADLKTFKRREETIINFIPKVKRILDVYWAVDDVCTRNSMLKSIIDHVEYLKTERSKKGQRNNASFLLHIYPKLPENL
ncbi:MAG: recombinase family protein [Clostridiaceae bacterium]|nr:recombinase family protein [Clostridiaceae bacterium]